MPKALIREPLVWFFIIGSAIFIMKGLWTEKPVDYQIRITEKDVSRIRSQWEAQSSKPLSDKELKSLIDGHVREEMLYREAIRLGLDQNDVIIRRRLVQKLKFLVEDVSKVRNPTDAVLREFFEKHSDKYFLPARISFSHLYFNTEKRGAALSNDLRMTMARLNEKAGNKVLSEIKWLGSGDPFMLPSTYKELTQSEAANLLGHAFANAIFKLNADNLWHGPVSSGFGEHLVRITGITPARQPDFEKVKKLVAKDFATAQRAKAAKDLINELEKKYRVFIDVLNEQPRRKQRGISKG